MITGSLTIQRLLGAIKRLDASDLHIKVGLPPIYRIGGRLKRIDSPPLTEEECDHLFDPILTPVQKERFENGGNLDLAWHLPDGDRFRIDLFRSGNHIHAAVRRVKAEIPSYAELHLPPVYSKIVSESPDGLVLICGVTGCGKSSTLAAMIEQLNNTEDVNIITVEDPIEYRFAPKMAVISQREVGIDVDSFKTALRFAVRQDPDVIFIGEMRDAETVLAGIQAAETGHLVFATLHTSDTMQSLNRMLEFFPPSERDFIRSSLANTLRAVCPEAHPRRRGFRGQGRPRLRGPPQLPRRPREDPRLRGRRPPRHHQRLQSRRHAELHPGTRRPRREGMDRPPDRPGLRPQPRRPRVHPQGRRGQVSDPGPPHQGRRRRHLIPPLPLVNLRPWRLTSAAHPTRRTKPDAAPSRCPLLCASAPLC
ncbi:MAG: Flp pilus assembly complex ATPase component TadA [Phycisphaerales bacterium]|nr:Flp pilus assembly complex ATPase component TadA [Phycisphaerales bacterium]